jgi:hypothetical protein
MRSKMSMLLRRSPALTVFSACLILGTECTAQTADESKVATTNVDGAEYLRIYRFRFSRLRVEAMERNLACYRESMHAI